MLKWLWRTGIADHVDAIADGYSVAPQASARPVSVRSQPARTWNQCVVVEDAAAGIEAARS